MRIPLNWKFTQQEKKRETSYLKALNKAREMSKNKPLRYKKKR